MFHKIHFKTPSVEIDYPKLDWRLRELFLPMASEHAESDVVVTDICTPGIHMAGGPHYEYRAVDLRLAPLTLGEWEAWAVWVNSVFDFGFLGFNVVLVGKTDPKGKHQDHVHIQVPRPLVKSGKVPLRW